MAQTELKNYKSRTLDTNQLNGFLTKSSFCGVIEQFQRNQWLTKKKHSFFTGDEWQTSFAGQERLKGKLIKKMSENKNSHCNTGFS